MLYGGPALILTSSMRCYRYKRTAMVQRSARGPARLAVLLFSAVVMVSSAAAIRPETSPRRNLLSTCDRLLRHADSAYPAPGELCAEPMTAYVYNTPEIPIIADTQRSGLQYLAPVVHDDPYTPIKPVRRGYNLTAANLFMGAQAGLSLANSYTRSVTYSSTDLGNGDIIHSDICEFVAGNNGVGDAIAINDVKLNQYNAIWLLDPANYMAIKLSTLSPPYAADITGEYYTHSSAISHTIIFCLNANESFIDCFDKESTQLTAVWR